MSRKALSGSVEDHLQVSLRGIVDLALERFELRVGFTDISLTVRLRASPRCIASSYDDRLAVVPQVMGRLKARQNENKLDEIAVQDSVIVKVVFEYARALGPRAPLRAGLLA
ncbi:hypothetical protein AAVH_18004 [Aphelenchoides avenae]|nr:hypothetical protein AAVH_18004 [Aphelenchus avenae]